MLTFDEQTKRFLREIGRTDVGRNIVTVLEEAKKQYSNINTIDKDRDANAQIEGRQMMSEMIDELSKMITTQKHQVKPKPTEDFT